jgi:cell shape-determining protein MreC
VARVTNVETAAGDAFAVVSAAPASALDRGRHVLVVAQSSQFEAAVAP